MPRGRVLDHGGSCRSARYSAALDATVCTYAARTICSGRLPRNSAHGGGIVHGPIRLDERRAPGGDALTVARAKQAVAFDRICDSFCCSAATSVESLHRSSVVAQEQASSRFRSIALLQQPAGVCGTGRPWCAFPCGRSRRWHRECVQHIPSPIPSTL